MDRLDKTGATAGRTPMRWSCRARPTRALLWAVIVSVLTTGCHLNHWLHNDLKVGPNYLPPPVPVSSQWIDYRNPQIKSEPTDLSEWWRVFKDPALDELIETAYLQNISLREAGSRIMEARAIRGIAIGNFFPQLQQLNGSQNRIKTSTKIVFGAPQQWFANRVYGATAAWELDFWGKFRRGIESADAELNASIQNYDDVLVILLADVASNYVQIRTFQTRLQNAYANVFYQRVATYLTKAQAQVGTRTKLDQYQAETTLQSTLALIPQLETGLRLANNRLCVLLGIPVQELTKLGVGAYERKLRLFDEKIVKEMEDKNKRFEIPRTAEEFDNLKKKVPPLPGKIPVAPPTVVLGIPADIVRRRPDVQRAEQQLAAQSARIGIATADFYPQIFINGNIGVAAEQFADLFHTPGSMLGAFGPSFQWPILNYGRILSNVQAQDARFQQLANSYQNTALVALREAEDGIISFLRTQDQAKRQQLSVDAANSSVTISYGRYRLGQADPNNPNAGGFLDVVVFLDALTQQQDRLAAVQGDIALSLIQTYRALGGGWEMRLTREPLPHSAYCAPGAAFEEPAVTIKELPDNLPPRLSISPSSTNEPHQAP